MRPPENMTRIIDRRRYSTATATLLAGDDYWDGHNFERRGRNTFLYRTPNGAYFVVNLSQWQGESNDIEPIDQETAIEFYEGHLREHYVSYEDAFPGVKIIDA